MTDDEVYVHPDGHRHNWDMRCTPVGPTTCMAETSHGGDPDVTNSATGEMAGGPERHLAGFHFMHDVPAGGPRCIGGVNIDAHFPERPIWTMEGSLAGGDLTLSPSINCRGASLEGHGGDFHGWVRNGAWQQA